MTKKVFDGLTYKALPPTPLRDGVLIDVGRRVETKTASGIVIPAMAQEIPDQGTVVSAGPKAKLVQVGERVVFSKRAGMFVEHDEAEYLLVAEPDVLAVLEP
jgi:chaperonin GroES